MKLLMKRLDQRRAVLYHGNRPWTRLMGIPATVASLPKGCYGLRLGYTEEKGWHVEVLGPKEGTICLILPLVSGNPVPTATVSPVTRFGSGAKFSKLALLKLLARLGRYADEEWRLEVLELPPKNPKERWRLAN